MKTVKVISVYGKSAHPVLELLGYTVFGFILTWTIHVIVMVCVFPVIKKCVEGKSK